MKTPKLQDRYIDALKNIGWTIYPNARTTKFVVLSKKDRFMFVGKSGSLRFGKTQSPSNSLPVSDTFKQDLLESLKTK